MRPSLCSAFRRIKSIVILGIFSKKSLVRFAPSLPFADLDSIRTGPPGRHGSWSHSTDKHAAADSSQSSAAPPYSFLGTHSSLAELAEQMGFSSEREACFCAGSGFGVL